MRKLEHGLKEDQYTQRKRKGTDAMRWKTKEKRTTRRGMDEGSLCFPPGVVGVGCAKGGGGGIRKPRRIFSTGQSASWLLRDLALTSPGK